MNKTESTSQRLVTTTSQPSTPQPTNKVPFKDETSPSFGSTEYKHTIVSIDRHTNIDVSLHTKIDRGFFLADSDWTCYRRNYFQVSGSFSLEGVGILYEGQDIPCLVKDHNTGNLEEIQYFMLGISARLSDCTKAIQLIQHTPKRDKGPQNVPAPKLIRPGGNIGFSSVGSSQSIVSFERLQFKHATANNGKRRAAQQYYVLVIELLVKLVNGNVLTVARNTSSPLVVRGRSPGHYADADHGVAKQPYRHHSTSGGPIIQHNSVQPHHPYQRMSNATTPTNEYPPYDYASSYPYGHMPPPPPPPPPHGHSYPSPSIPVMQHHYFPSIHDRTNSNDSTYPDQQKENNSSPYYWQRQDMYENQQETTRLRMASNQSNTSVESGPPYLNRPEQQHGYYSSHPYPYQPLTQSSLPPPPPPPLPSVNHTENQYYQSYDWRNKMPAYPYDTNNERQSPPSSTTVSSPLSSSNRETTIVK